MKKFIAFEILVLILVALNLQAVFIGNEKEEVSDISNDSQTKTLKSQRYPASDEVIAKGEVEKSTQSTQPTNKLEALKSCFKSGDCPFAKTDSRSYHIEVSKAIASELAGIYQKVISNNIINEKVSMLAREYMQFDDGHIKEKCIELLSTQETNWENLNSLLNNALLYHSDKLIEPVLMEIRRYRNQGFDETIENYFEKVITTSSPAVREKLTSQMADFINENNFEKFNELLQKIPKNSNSYAYLKSALDRFRYR